MSQAPKTDLARELWEMCPKCYGDLQPSTDGELVCPEGHYRAENATSLTPEDTGGSRLVADGGGPECQLSDCEAAATATVEHPEYGGIQVCRTCSRLWEGSQ